jgi:predicted alpha/beta superfamily hydrolase
MHTLFSLAVTVIFAVAASAADGTAFSLPNTEVHHLRAANGFDYDIHLWWPTAEAPDVGYPVLYLLDGHDNFAVAAATAERMERFSPRSGVAPGIIVAVSAANLAERAISFTPATSGQDVSKTGGADAFITFIETALKPFVEKRFKIDQNRQTLMGHSYGGLFTLHVLFTRPELFESYIAVSPSIWFGDMVLLQEEATFVDRQRAEPAARRLFLWAGEYEQTQPPPLGLAPAVRAKTLALARHRMVDNAREMAWRLETLAPYGLTTRFMVANGATHGTSMLPALGDAMTRAFPLTDE